MSDLESARETIRWLRYSHEDLLAAERLLANPDSAPRHACALAQQAVEKALKASLIALQIEFPFRHDLDALRNLLPETWEVRRQYADLAELTEWSVEARYPGDWPEATFPDARKAVEHARSVIKCLRVDLLRLGLIPNPS